MAAVPPPSDSEEPDTLAFGIAVLDDRLRSADVGFPATASTLVQELDDPAIPVDPHGRTVRLSDAVDRTGRTRFENRRDFLNALHPVFEQERGRGGGIRGLLRRLWPL